MSVPSLSELIENFKTDYDTQEYKDSEGNPVEFYDSEGTRIYPLKNDPAKYPFQPVIFNDPPSFPKENITQANLTDLRVSHNNNNPNFEINLKITNEVNEIKYRILYANNLGQKNYEHLYFVEHDTDSQFPDYFTEILDKLISVFPDVTLEYTLLKDGHNKTVTNTNTNIHKNDYNSKKSGNITRKENGKYSISNIIKISWS
jgi:hypothetical protein